MSRERELEKFVKEAFVNGFLVGSENGTAATDMKERLNAPAMERTDTGRSASSPCSGNTGS